mgnify:FL=1
MKKALMKLAVGIVSAFLVIGVTGCGNDKSVKAKELTDRAAAVSAKMQKEITENPMKAAEVQAKYQSELDAIKKESEALAK